MKRQASIPDFRMETLSLPLSESVNRFQMAVFAVEQHIPAELIPIEADLQYWWGIRHTEQIIGTVAAWEQADGWHWGRFAVHQAYRGQGLGKQLAFTSFQQLFSFGIEHVKLEARDLTVEMLMKMGGKITGPTTHFYGNPITPMEIRKKDFLAGIAEQ